MIFKSQTMRQIMATMMEVADIWQNSKWKSKDEMINPDAPVVIQVGDYGYEVQSIGGDGDHEGFVIMCKEAPVCKWEDMECIKL